jgi:hypothetical protein
MSAMSFYKSIPGIIIDGDIEEAVEETDEPVVEKLYWTKKKKGCIQSEVKTKVEVEAVVEEEGDVVEELVAMALEMALEEFKQEKTKVLRKFTNSLKLASSRETILAVIVEFQQSIATMADKFKEASTFAEAEPVEPVEPVVKKKVFKLKPKEGVTYAEIDKAFLEKFEGLEVEEPKKKKVVKKKSDGASTSHT